MRLPCPAPYPAVVRYDLARSIQSLERALKRLTLAALELVLSDPQLARETNYCFPFLASA